VGAYFAPFGKVTEVTLESDWTAPSFQGTWLPTDRNFSDSGFTATWKVPFLGRNYLQSWRYTKYEDIIPSTVFGVDLISPVDHYRMSERSIKYQLLFIFLTFAALWLFEILSRMRIHFIQYFLVGAGMCLFYLLEISLSEHIGFIGAYITASAMIILLITLYSITILRTGSRAAIMGAVVTLLYLFLYILLTIQDYALLIGSIALFFILALIMFLTRKIDWYSTNVKLPKKAE
jgi:inner membrane protein